MTGVNFQKHFIPLPCSNEFINIVREITGVEKLYPDYGLGGMYIHNRGGKLNVHKDCDAHPG